MKNITYSILLGIILIFPSCKSADSLYEEFLIPNGRSYPAKALNLEAHSGRERIAITWQNGSDPKVVKARISWNNYTQWEEIDIVPGMNIISRIIAPLDENTYSFIVRTYDDEGNISVPVEVIGAAYGEAYEGSLVNRSMKNALYDDFEGVFRVEWNESEEREAGIEISYTDVEDRSQTWMVDPSETVTTISDLKSGTPVSYKTVYKPDSTAIDLFYAPAKQIRYEAKITANVLKNTVAPFARGAMMVNNRWFAALDWTANASAAINGNVDTHETLLHGVLGFWAGWGLGPAGSIENGKLYQTVELEAGTYRFEAYLFQNNQSPTKAYVVAALGNDLPDTDDVEQTALAFTLVPHIVPTNSNVKLSVDFVLSEKSDVSLGFVITCGQPTQVYFRRVELFRAIGE